MARAIKIICIAIVLVIAAVTTIFVATNVVTLIPGANSTLNIIGLSPSGSDLYYCRVERNEIVDYNFSSAKSQIIGKVSTAVFPFAQIDDNKGWIGAIRNSAGTDQLVRLSNTFAVRNSIFPSKFSDNLPIPLRDGKSMLFVRAHRQYGDGWGTTRWTDFDIYKGDIEGKNAKRITNIIAKTISRPSINPDGTTAVFSSDKITSRHTSTEDILNEIDLKSLVVRQILPTGTRSIQPCYSPNGSEIVFSSDRKIEYKYELWIVNRDGTGLRQVTTLGRQCSHPVFLPDGKNIAMTVDRNELWLVSIDGTNAHRVE